MTAKELLRARVESLSEEEAEIWLDEMTATEETRISRLSPVEIARLPVEERWAYARPETWEVDMEEFLEWDALAGDGLDLIDG